MINYFGSSFCRFDIWSERGSEWDENIKLKDFKQKRTFKFDAVVFQRLLANAK